jgi:hypothetical protein
MRATLIPPTFTKVIIALVLQICVRLEPVEWHTRGCNITKVHLRGNMAVSASLTLKMRHGLAVGSKPTAQRTAGPEVAVKRA